MTTVCYDGKILAADSRATASTSSDKDYKCSHCGESAHHVREDAVKIHGDFGALKYRGELIYAMAGSGASTDIDKMVRLVKEGEDLDELYRISALLSTGRVIEASFLVVTEQSVFRINYPDGKRKAEVTKDGRDIKIAIGSGTKAADVAMKIFGLNATEAVMCAAVVDKGTGGDIRWVDCTLPVGKKDALTVVAPQANELVIRYVKHQVVENAAAELKAKPQATPAVKRSRLKPPVSKVH
jgi:hypothetical protein